MKQSEVAGALADGMESARGRRIAISLPDPTLSLHGLFERWAARQPDAIALESERATPDGVRTLSYAALNVRANQLARHLEQHGVRERDAIAVHLHSSVELVVSILAVLKLGATYVPIEPSYPRSRREHMLRTSGASRLLTNSELDQSWSDSSVAVTRLDAEWSTLGSHEGENLCVTIDPRTLAYVIYTSGSTGSPKGVMVEHLGASNNIQAGISATRVGPGSRMLQFASISFDLSVWEFFVSLGGGGTLCLPSDRGLLLSARLRDVLLAFRVNTVFLPPSVLSLLDPHELPSITEVAAGGEAVPADLVAKWLPGRRFVNLYGPTEVSVICAAAECEEGGHKPCIGWPFPGNELYVLEPGTFESVATGELCIGGNGVARGYVNDPAATARTFVASELTTQRSQLYRTGDLVRRLPSGALEYLGRLDRQVKINGQRIEPGEVEATLAAHPAVKRAAVVVREGEHGARRLVAYVVLSADIDEAALAAFLRERLPTAFLPSAIVLMSELPLNRSGKLDETALPVPESAARAYVLPRTEREQAVAALVCELLGCERVSMADNFFALGADSLLAIRLLELMRSRLGLRLEACQLIENPGLASCAERAVAITGDFVAEVTARYDDVASEALREFALTPLQEAYALGQTEGVEAGSVPTLACFEYERAPLSVPRLRAAIHALIRRHPMLRTVVTERGRQCILEHAPLFVVGEIDLRRLCPVEREARLASWHEHAARTVWNPRSLPRFAIDVVQLDGAARLSFRYDFSMLDFWSVQRLLRELIELHDQPDAALPALEFDFSDYVRARSRLIEGARYAQAKAYWLERIASLPPGPALPSARAGALEESVFARRSIALDPRGYSTLKRHGARFGLTPTGVVLAAFVDVLSVWSDSESFTIDVPVFDPLPLHPHVDRVLGDFTGIVLLEVRDPRAGTFLERARRLQAQLWHDFEHRHFDGVEVLRELNRAQQRAPGATAPVVFTSLFSAHQERARESRLGRVVWGHSSTPQVWLDCHVRESAGSLEIDWDVLQGVFADGLVSTMIEALARWLRSLADEEASWHASWTHLAEQLLPDEQRRRRADFNATHAEFSSTLLHVPFEERAASVPDYTALVAAAGCEVTYGALRADVSRAACWLSAQGVVEGELVGVMLPKSTVQVVVVLAILSAGGAYLPLDVNHPADRVRRLIAQAGLRRVWCSAAASCALAALDPEVQWLDPAVALASGSSESSCSSRRPDDLAYVIHTSGSTGLPSGVMITHAAASNTICDVNRRYGIGPSDRVLALSELTFDLSVWDLFGVLGAGGVMVLPSEDGKRDPEHWLELIDRHRVTVWNSVPAMLEMLLDYVDGTSRMIPRSLRLVLLSGDWVSTALPTRLSRLCPAARLVALGGATEGAIWSIAHEVTTLEADAPSIPYGKPLSNQRVYVLSPRLTPCPEHVPGELYIGGTGVAQGYLAEAEKTATRFVIHPRSGERLYSTGDFGRFLPEGYIEFLGRRDSQLKLRGHRVELGEIEAALRADPQVRRAIVIVGGTRRSPRGLVAFVVAAAGDSIDATRTLAVLRGQLPDYMVPDVVHVLDALPLTTTGKVDRARLEQLAAARLERRAVGAPAVSDAERQLAQVWKEVLSLASVGIDEDFFELGGDSLLAIQIVARAARSGYHFRPSDLYQQRTIAGLVSIEHSERAPREAEPVCGPVRLLPGQAWFLAQGLLEPHLWHEGHYLVARERLDARVLNQVLRALFDQHDGLRTRFERGAVDWSLRIAECEENDELEVVATQLEAGAAIENEAMASARRLQQQLSLSDGPLLKGELLRSRDHDVLVLVGHHLVLDGYSWRIVLEDMQRLYVALLSGKDERLRRTTPLQHWAEAVHRRAHDADVLAEREFWTRGVSGKTFALPQDRPGKPSAETVCSVYGALSVEFTATLARRRSKDVTFQHLLLSVFAQTMHDIFDGDVLVLDVLAHGRSGASIGLNVARTVGRFTTVFPLHLDLRMGAALERMIAEVRMQFERVPHQGMGAALLAYTCDIAEVRHEMECAPKAQICFNYAGTFDNALLANSPFRKLGEVPRGGTLRMGGDRRYVLELNCGVMDERLQLEWRFSENILNRTTVEHWSGALMARLEAHAATLESR